jgi:hypothetical protein
MNEIYIAFGITLVIMTILSGFNIATYYNQKAINKANNDNAVHLKELDHKYGNLLHQANTKFSYLQQRRVQVIEEMYEKLWVLHKDAEAYISFGNAFGNFPDMQGVVQVWKDNLEKSSEAFYEFYHRKKLLFSDELNKDMEALIAKIRNAEFDFTLYRNRIQEGKQNMILQTEAVKRGYKNELEEAKAEKKEVVRIVREELPKDVQAIMDKFQDLIGVIDKQKK